jgi:glycosyltransferase involved in cell wall biosynthesis
LALQCRNTWLSAASNPDQVEHLFAVDADDEASCVALSAFPHRVVQIPNGGCVAAWNLAAANARGRVLVQLSDDWEPIPGWDDVFTARLGDLEAPRVLRISDGHRIDDLLCMAICTRARYEQQGFFLAPSYRGLYSDDEFSFRAYRDSVVVDAQDVVLRHAHPNHDETIPMDSTYQRQNSLPREIHGRQQFLSRNPSALYAWLHAQGHGRQYVPVSASPAADATLPRISVIMRTRNRPQLMRRALESIVQQSYPQVELIVVAHEEALTYASELLEGTKSAHGLQSRIVQARPGSSLGALLNQGIAEATGHWIIALDDDDTWHHTCLERLAATLLSNAAIASRAAACQYAMVHESINKSGELVESHRTHSGGEMKPLLLTRQIGRNQIVIHGFLYEKSLWSELGGYREDLPVAEDWDFNLRCLRVTEILIHPEPLAHYHIRANSLDQTYTAGRMLHNQMQAHFTNSEVRRIAHTPEGRSQIYLAGQISQAIAELGDEVGRLRLDLEAFRKRESSLQKQLTAADKDLKATQKRLAEEKESNRAIRKRWIFKLLRRFRILAIVPFWHLLPLKNLFVCLSSNSLLS